jgi:hypothetical protein
VDFVLDSPKVNVFCALSKDEAYGPFLFSDLIFTGMTYLDTLELWLWPQLTFLPVYSSRRMGHHLIIWMCEFLNEKLPASWKWRAGLTP